MPDTQTLTPDDGSHPRGPLFTSEQAARLIMKSPEHVKQLSRAGWIAHEVRNNHAWVYRLLDIVQGYIRYRDDEDRRVNQTAAQQRITDARSREVELRNALREGKLIELEDAIDAIEGIIALLRLQLSGLPARVTRDLQLRRTIETAVHDILDKTADLANERAQALEARRDATEAVAPNGAGPVGGGEPDAPAVVGSAGAA